MKYKKKSKAIRMQVKKTHTKSSIIKMQCNAKKLHYVNNVIS